MTQILFTAPATATAAAPAAAPATCHFIKQVFKY